MSEVSQVESLATPFQKVTCLWSQQQATPEWYCDRRPVAWLWVIGGETLIWSGEADHHGGCRGSRLFMVKHRQGGMLLVVFAERCDRSCVQRDRSLTASLRPPDGCLSFGGLFTGPDGCHPRFRPNNREIINCRVQLPRNCAIFPPLRQDCALFLSTMRGHRCISMRQSGM